MQLTAMLNAQSQTMQKKKTKTLMTQPIHAKTSFNTTRVLDLLEKPRKNNK